MAKGEFNKEQLLQDFGEVLRAHRKEAGLSQERLALETGLDRTYISLLERGLRAPTIYTIFLLTEKLGIKPSRMIAELEGTYFFGTP